MELGNCRLKMQGVGGLKQGPVLGIVSMLVYEVLVDIGRYCTLYLIYAYICTYKVEYVL
jgi:hypothetical protein